MWIIFLSRVPPDQCKALWVEKNNLIWHLLSENSGAFRDLVFLLSTDLHVSRKGGRKKPNLLTPQP